jgi:hypothetical protein
MCTAVASWYRRSGPLSTDEIVDLYRELALNTLGLAAHPARAELEAASS